MPTYEYVCKNCGEHLEVVQSFKDEPLTTCPTCGGDLRKVFGSIGIAFKGSGFYKTDSRGPAPKESSGSSGSSSSPSSSPTPSSPSSDGKSSSGGSGGKSSTSTESKSASA